MAISKDKKHEIVGKLSDAFKEANSVAFVGFTKLTVTDSVALRKELGEAGVRFFVAKKTLIRKALEGGKYDGTVPELPGEVAIAWTTDDVMAPSHGVYDFGRKMKVKETLALLGGIFDGALIDAPQMNAIAAIPSMLVLRGMFVNVVNSPIQNFVIALDQIREKKS